MFRILITIAVAGIVGFGLGQAQAWLATSGYEERFLGSRATLAELRGDMTEDEVVAMSQGSPEVEVVGGTTFNFGTMQHGEEMSHEFVFRNVGTGPLNLDMGSSTCKCTVGELDKAVLQPGEDTIVTLTWSAQSITPEYGQSATIHTNDPTNSQIQLSIRGQIADSFVIEPRRMNLGSISVNEPLSGEFQVYCYYEKAQELSEFTWTTEKSADLVSFSAVKRDIDPQKDEGHTNAKSVYDIRFDIEPGLPIGPLNSRISFRSNLGDRTGDLSLPVTGTVAGDLTLIGGSSYDPEKNIVTFGTVSSEEGATVNLWLAVQGKDRNEIVPEIKSIVPQEALEVSIGEPKMAGRRKMFPLKFEVPKGVEEVYYPGTSSKTFGKVVIGTDHADTKELPIYIRLTVIQ